MDPERVQADIEMLVETGFDFANEKLDEGGEFFPFGMSIDVDQAADDDELNFLEPSPDEGDVDEEDAINALMDAFRDGKDRLRAVAVVFDAVLDEEWDAITVLVAHADGEIVDVQLPYKLVKGKRVFGEVEQADGSLEIWT